MSSFLDLVDAVGAYYGTGSDQWNTIAQGGINSPEALDIIRQVPGVNVTTSNSGQILGYDFENAFPSSAPASSAINSNTQTGAFNNSFSGNIPGNAVPPSTDLPNGGMNSGAKLTGTGATIASVADKISLAVAGVALGTKLGKLIDSGIYASNPEWFDEHFPNINPETWDDIATTEGGKNVIRAIFGLNNDSATMYVDERLLAQAFLMYKANGAYDSGTGEVNIDNVNIDPITDSRIRNRSHDIKIQSAINIPVIGGGSYVNGSATITGNFEYIIAQQTSLAGNVSYIAISRTPFTGTKIVKNSQGAIVSEDNFTSTIVTNNNITYYGAVVSGSYISTSAAYGNFIAITKLYENSGALYTSVVRIWDIAYLVFNGTIITPQTLPGVTDNPNASTFINPNLIDDNNALQDLKTNYPELFNGSIYTDVPQPDGTTTTITFIPVPYPNNANTAQPTSDTTPDINPQTNPEVNPSNRPNAAENVATEVTSPVNNAPDTGTGTSPTTALPTGGASSLWAVYNPTQAQVDDFGAWLWSSNFVEQIKKLFSDPMQGIIGLHKIFATPATGAAQNIKVGYLDSGVPSAVVTSQYTDVDCGAVNVAEYFGNVFDYEDTNIRLYLPFIGIVDLSTSDVMRGNVRVVYHVDVITGACLADVIVSRDGAGGVLYQYSGDAAVRYPVSSGSYMGMVSGVLAIAGAVVGVASGGAALPAVMGAVGGIMNSHTDVKHSGSFSGAAGAMGAKIPYLIIERPQTAIANDFASYQGIGDNRVVNIGSLAGYFKMTDVHTEGVVNASEQEIEQIKALLEGGVIQ